MEIKSPLQWNGNAFQVLIALGHCKISFTTNPECFITDYFLSRLKDLGVFFVLSTLLILNCHCTFTLCFQGTSFIFFEVNEKNRSLLYLVYLLSISVLPSYMFSQNFMMGFCGVSILPTQNKHQSGPENLNITQVHHTIFSIYMTNSIWSWD